MLSCVVSVHWHDTLFLYHKANFHMQTFQLENSLTNSSAAKHVSRSLANKNRVDTHSHHEAQASKRQHAGGGCVAPWIKVILYDSRHKFMICRTQTPVVFHCKQPNELRPSEFVWKFFFFSFLRIDTNTTNMYAHSFRCLIYGRSSRGIHFVLHGCYCTLLPCKPWKFYWYATYICIRNNQSWQSRTTAIAATLLGPLDASLTGTGGVIIQVGPGLGQHKLFWLEILKANCKLTRLICTT